MELFGIGAWEVAVIIVLALIFIGPRDMPRLAIRFAKFLRELRTASGGFIQEWKREIESLDPTGELRELGSEFVEAKQAIQDTGADLRKSFQSIGSDMEDTAKTANEATKNIGQTMSDTAKEVNKASHIENPKLKPAQNTVLNTKSKNGISVSNGQGNHEKSSPDLAKPEVSSTESQSDTSNDKQAPPEAITASIQPTEEGANND